MKFLSGSGIGSRTPESFEAGACRLFFFLPLDIAIRTTALKRIDQLRTVYVGFVDRMALLTR
jgi:hypothetical protein